MPAGAPKDSVPGTTVAGVFVGYAPTFTAKGSRVFAPCGKAALCFGVKTARQIGGLPPQNGFVTAVCAGSLREDKVEPLATGSATGEVRLWDSRSYAQLGKIRFAEPVLALRWPRPGILTVYLGWQGAGPGRVEHVQVDDLTAPRRGTRLPLQVAVASAAFDAVDDVVALGDVNNLLVWSEGWTVPRRYPLRDSVTAIVIDSDKQFVAVGDSYGAVSTWWGILGEHKERVTPARWHWHPSAVRCLALCGPTILSGSDEGVLCVRQKLDSSGEVRFIPRFPGPLRHLAVGAGGTRVCASLGGNTLALMDNLLGKVHPTYIHGIDVPLMLDLPNAENRGQLLHETRVLYPLASGGIAMTSSGRRVEFLTDQGVMSPLRTLEVDRGLCVHSISGPPEYKWKLWHIAFSPNAEHILTCESRRTPARENFMRKRAAASVLKWWTRTGSGYKLHSVAHNVHTEPLSAVLAHPQQERRFITASLDGTFKFWDLVVADSSEGAQQSWQCVLAGSWHSQPIHCGCLSADGSALALGLRGFVTLWDMEDGSELSKLALSEPQQDVHQLQSVVTSLGFLLIAHVRSRASEEVLCWDLRSLQILARLDLKKALKGHHQQCLVRTTSPAEAGGSLHLLAHRSQGRTLELWRLQQDDQGLSSFQHISTTRLEIGILDALFVGSELCLLCWTTAFEIWRLDLSKSGRPVAPPPSEALAAADDEPETKVSRFARVVGGKAIAEGASAPLQTKAWQLTIPPVRTTAPQQAGLVPRFLETVIPPHIPSHMLHPPTMIWSSMLATFSKPNAAALEGLDIQTGVAKAVGVMPDSPGQQVLGSTSAENDLPPWMIFGAAAEVVSQPEVVEATWMDELVRDALQAS